MPVASPAMAAGERSLDFRNLRGDDRKTFDELPGVELRPDRKRDDGLVCVTRYIEPRLGVSWRIRRELYYSCTNKDGVTFESDRAPFSRERDMRGYGW